VIEVLLCRPETQLIAVAHLLRLKAPPAPP